MVNMIVITNHAVHRYMERSSVDVSREEAFKILLAVIKLKWKAIRDTVTILKEARVEIDDEMIAIVVKRNGKLKMVTCRQKKEGVR